jgi:ATP-dependent Clp protease ATP-binding subunit ClpA
MTKGGQLTEAVRLAPHSLVLLDEVDKGHPDCLSILLQVMDDVILTDGKGHSVNFKNAILIMTSNVGSGRIVEIARASDELPSNSKSSAALRNQSSWSGCRDSGGSPAQTLAVYSLGSGGAHGG